MGKKASLLATQRAQITVLWQEGDSERMIASKLYCSKAAVYTAKVNFMKYGNYKDRKRSERLRKSTPKDDNMMKRIVARSLTCSCQKIKTYLSQKGAEVSLKTISRRFCDQFNLKLCKPARKPRLTPHMKIKRLAFAKKYESWTAKDWSQVMFSDESTFQQFVVQKGHVGRPKGKRSEEKYIMPTVKHPPAR